MQNSPAARTEEHRGTRPAPISPPATSLQQPRRALAPAFAPAEHPTLWVKDHVFETRRQDRQVPTSALPIMMSDRPQALPATATNSLQPIPEGTWTHWNFSKTPHLRGKAFPHHRGSLLRHPGLTFAKLIAKPAAPERKGLSVKANSHDKELMGFLLGRGQRGAGVRGAQTIAPPALTCG